MIPCIFAYAILQCHARFLQTQNNVIPMIASIGTATLQRVGLWYTRPALDTEVLLWRTSSPIGSMHCYYLFMSEFLPLARIHGLDSQRRPFHGIPTFLKLSIPSALMTR